MTNPSGNSWNIGPPPSDHAADSLWVRNCVPIAHQNGGGNAAAQIKPAPSEWQNGGLNQFWQFTRPPKIKIPAEISPG